jgi:hypothetical protein
MTTSTILSDALASPKGQMRASQGKVTVGDSVRLVGKVPEFDGARATLQFLPAGESEWRPQRQLPLGPAGGFDVAVKPHQTGLWRASAPGERTTSATRVRVRSRVDVGVTERHIMGGRETTIKGLVAPQTADRKVVISVGGDELTTKTNGAGRFEVDWDPPSIGSYKVSAVAKGDRLAAGSKDKGGLVNVYRSSVASWYSGGATACGGSATGMGVAHRTLPCGTKVKMRHGNNTVTVRVIDRGPFISGREWDLTAEAKNALGCSDLCTVLSTK